MIEKITIAIILTALITYAIRVLPLLVFRKEITNTYVKSFLNYVPYGVLASMTFPDILSSTPHFISAAAGTAVAIVLAFHKKSLVVVAICSIVMVYLVEILPL